MSIAAQPCPYGAGLSVDVAICFLHPNLPTFSQVTSCGTFARLTQQACTHEQRPWASGRIALDMLLWLFVFVNFSKVEALGMGPILVNGSTLRRREAVGLAGTEADVHQCPDAAKK